MNNLKTHHKILANNVNEYNVAISLLGDFKSDSLFVLKRNAPINGRLFYIDSDENLTLQIGNAKHFTRVELDNIIGQNSPSLKCLIAVTLKQACDDAIQFHDSNIRHLQNIINRK